jgi:hypothetical protein
LEARLDGLTRSLAELDGKGAKRPGLARMICSFEYRFDEDERFAWSRYPVSVRDAGF